MQRISSTPRAGWRTTVTEQGLLNVVNVDAAGNETPYWNESAAYEISVDEVDELERTTDELYDMVIQACRYMVDDTPIMDRLALPRMATEYIRSSLETPHDNSVYCRFDLAYDGVNPAKLLECNADTPAALFEAAVTQWYWLEDMHPDKDQWNLVHERLVRAWTSIAKVHPETPVHFAVGEREPDEDWVTVAYLRDTAREAGIVDLGITMQEIGWNDGSNQFVDAQDKPIDVCFKMWPWDWMFTEDFGGYIAGGDASTAWIEPAWKVLAGSKAILPVLWSMFPDHPNLLPAYFDDPHGMTQYAAKPMFGFEGAGVQIVTAAACEAEDPRHTAGQQIIYQQYTELPVFDGNRAICGTWVIDGEASGLGIRESTSLITNLSSRFVPHYMDAPRSSDEDIARWNNPTTGDINA